MLTFFVAAVVFIAIAINDINSFEFSAAMKMVYKQWECHVIKFTSRAFVLVTDMGMNNQRIEINYNDKPPE